MERNMIIGMSIFLLGVFLTYKGIFKYQESVTKWHKINAYIKKIVVVEKKNIEHFDDFYDDNEDNKFCLDPKDYKKEQKNNKKNTRKLKVQNILIEKQKKKIKENEGIIKKLDIAKKKLSIMNNKNIELEKKTLKTSEDILKRIKFEYSYSVLGDEFTNIYYLPWKKDVSSDYELYKKKKIFNIFYNIDNPSLSRLILPDDGNSEIMLGFVLLTCGMYISFYACPKSKEIKILKN